MVFTVSLELRKNNEKESQFYQLYDTTVLLFMKKNKTKLKKHKYWTRSEKPLRFIPIKQNNMFYLLFHGPGLP